MYYQSKQQSAIPYSSVISHQMALRIFISAGVSSKSKIS